MAQQPTIVSLAEVLEPAQCRHHWVIQPATGPVSQGMCQTCGEERDFKNYVESASWGDTRLGNRSRGATNVDEAETVASRRDDREKER